MYCEGATVPIQHGAGAGGGEAGPCNIIVNHGGNPVHLSAPKSTRGASYGMHMRFDCGNNIETRFAHIQGYNGNTQTIINGRTGSAWNTPPHYHYEIYVDGHAVDPECVFGMIPAKSDNVTPTSVKCPVFGGPANLCDPNVVRQLKEHARRKLKGTSPGTSQPPATAANSRHPNTFERAIYGDPCKQIWNGQPQCSDPNQQCERHDPKEVGEHDHGGGDFDLSPAPWIIDGTGPRTDNPPIGGGDPGGKIIWGEDNPPAEIPPIVPSEGGEVTSCALDTWVAMTNQSVMEARREKAMQGRFIAKADSVIEYSCLAMHLEQTQGEGVAGIFSETDRWVNFEVPIGTPYPPGDNKKFIMYKTLGPLSMDSSLLNVVWASYETYKKNFAHPLMGGLEGYNENPNGAACADMQKIWTAAKCQNFPAGEDAFPRFTDLIGKDNDPRKFPQNMKCTDTGINQGMIDAAKNKATRFDKVKPRFEWLGPPEEDAACKAPIPTGITVYRHQPMDKKSLEYKTAKMFSNIKNRDFVTTDELKKAFPKLEDREKIIELLKKRKIKIIEGEAPDDLKVDLLGGGDYYAAAIKTYEDGVCSNAGCSYDNGSLSGPGQCIKDVKEEDE